MLKIWCCSCLLWLILGATWLGHCTQILGQICLDVAVKAFLKWDEHLWQQTLSKADYSLWWLILCAMVWVGLIQSVEGLKRKTDILWGRGNSARRLPVTSALSWVSSLPACPADFGLTSLYNHVNQFFKIPSYPSIYLSVYHHLSIYLSPIGSIFLRTLTTTVSKGLK